MKTEQWKLGGKGKPRKDHCDVNQQKNLKKSSSLLECRGGVYYIPRFFQNRKWGPERLSSTSKSTQSGHARAGVER